MPIIPATQEVERRGLQVQGQLWQSYKDSISETYKNQTARGAAQEVELMKHEAVGC
jgi:hypothetical protein